jgi:hypothetical protein
VLEQVPRGSVESIRGYREAAQQEFSLFLDHARTNKRKGPRVLLLHKPTAKAQARAKEVRAGSLDGKAGGADEDEGGDSSENEADVQEVRGCTDVQHCGRTGCA